MCLFLSGEVVEVAFLIAVLVTTGLLILGSWFLGRVDKPKSRGGFRVKKVGARMFEATFENGEVYRSETGIIWYREDGYRLDFAAANRLEDAVKSTKVWRES